MYQGNITLHSLPAHLFRSTYKFSLIFFARNIQKLPSHKIFVSDTYYKCVSGPIGKNAQCDQKLKLLNIIWFYLAPKNGRRIYQFAVGIHTIHSRCLQYLWICVTHLKNSILTKVMYFVSLGDVVLCVFRKRDLRAKLRVQYKY